MITWFEADTPQELNTSIFRCRIPARQLARAGHNCYISHIHEILNGNISTQTQQKINDSDVIVLERLLTTETHNFIKEQRDRGKLVVATFDDNYALIPGSPSRSTWRGGKSAMNGRGAILNEFRQGLRLVDKYIVPSKLLLDDFKAFNPNGEYVPNFLDDDIWRDIKRRESDVITIGYGGTSLHNRSLLDSGVIPWIGGICQQFPKVVMHLQPGFPDVLESFNKYKVRYKVGAWQPHSDWPKTVATFDIGISPLSGNYDNHRSSLRTQELGMAGVPWVATSAPPYQDARGGILVDNKSRRGLTWGSAIESLIRDKTLYTRLSEEGRAWATEFNSKCAETYERVFNSQSGG